MLSSACPPAFSGRTKSILLFASVSRRKGLASMRSLGGHSACAKRTVNYVGVDVDVDVVLEMLPPSLPCGRVESAHVDSPRRYCTTELLDNSRREAGNCIVSRLPQCFPYTRLSCWCQLACSAISDLAKDSCSSRSVPHPLTHTPSLCHCRHPLIYTCVNQCFCRTCTIVALLLLFIYVQVPRLVSLLAESFNAHMRFGSCLAIGISCAGTGSREAMDVLEPMMEDVVDFVRQVNEVYQLVKYSICLPCA